MDASTRSGAITVSPSGFFQHGHETTYSQDVRNDAHIRAEVERLARVSVTWLHRHGLWSEPGVA